MFDERLVKSVHVTLFKQYISILKSFDKNDLIYNEHEDTSITHLIWMCETAILKIDDWPIDKTSRWLGYIQGCMTIQGMISTVEEREFSRPLFHAAYGEDAPKTVDRTI